MATAGLYITGVLCWTAAVTLGAMSLAGLAAAQTPAEETSVLTLVVVAVQLAILGTLLIMFGWLRNK